MVQSWGANYFKTPGLRVLWLVPRAWIDAAMPAQATPTPTEHLRVYVGRLEGLSTDDRNRAQAAVEAVGQRGAAASVADLGHFAEARLRALRPELTEPLATQCDALIAEALLVP